MKIRYVSFSCGDDARDIDRYKSDIGLRRDASSNVSRDSCRAKSVRLRLPVEAHRQNGVGECTASCL